MLLRRTLLAAAVIIGFGTPAMAQDYPARPIKLVVPFGAGTTADIVARVFGEGIAHQLGQPVVIENKAGAGGNVGVSAVARGTAEGYTILLGTVGTHAINPTLFSKPDIDVMKEFAPIAFAGSTPTLLIVSAQSPYKTLKDLRDAAASGKHLSFASAGNGSSGHLAGELLKLRVGGDMVHVPYKEGATALNDVMAGQVDFMFYHPVAALPHIRANKLRALGVSTAQRTSIAPELPTIQEQGVERFDLMAWMMLYAPAKAPAAVLAKLRDASTKAVRSEAIHAKLAALGLSVPTMDEGQMANFGATESQKWAELVKLSGARVD
ncbi:Bug family tripartite tricarboxylate transporter substrate binding protein [Variovorax sp. ZT4R33]|uniref:Bug family tripartite tricarboxylate transporter substrate binding protein n=1 Tax=Variovorax sp. ZT4R33 TaxID=3443743 RepID=UPI003F47BEC5